MSMKNSNDNIGNQPRHLPTCSAVPQPNAPPRVTVDPSTITTLALCSGRLKPSVHTDVGWLPSLSSLDAKTQGTIASLRVSRSPDRTNVASVHYQLKICLMSATSKPTFQSILLPIVVRIGVHLLRVTLKDANEVS
jgi:hypothetical protein